MKKLLTLFPVLILIMSLVAGVASAHVTIDPNQVPQDSWQKLTIKVPTEKDIPTTKVKIVVPDKAEIMNLEPAPGWTYAVEKDANGKITSITWTAEGKGLLPGEFMQFNVMAKVAKDAKTLRFKAYQTYQDGSLVKWIGPEDSDHPAPVIKVTALAANDTATTDNSSLPLYLSIAAVVLSVIALILSLVKRKK